MLKVGLLKNLAKLTKPDKFKVGHITLKIG